MLPADRMTNNITEIVESTFCHENIDVECKAPSVSYARAIV